jgi:hypothetical protein
LTILTALSVKVVNLKPENINAHCPEGSTSIPESCRFLVNAVQSPTIHGLLSQLSSDLMVDNTYPGFAIPFLVDGCHTLAFSDSVRYPSPIT